MKVSLSGLLKKAAMACEAKRTDGGSHFYGGEGFAIRELLQNLQELKTRKAEGEKVIDEFFKVYVLE